MRYWVYSDSQILGPFGREELGSVSGLSGSSLVCSESVQGLQDADWVPLASVGDLATLELARSSAPVALAPAGEEAPLGFEPPALSPWDPPESSRWAQARHEAERERERELEERVLSLREEVAAYELRQDQILETLSRKDRQIAQRDRAIEELRLRLEKLERSFSSSSPAAAAPAHAPAPVPTLPRVVEAPVVRQAPASGYVEIVPAPVERPARKAETPAPAPAVEQPMGFESPRPTPLKSSGGLPKGVAFSPPMPAAPPAPPAAPEELVVMRGDGIPRESLYVEVSSAPEVAPPPPPPPAPPATAEIRVVGGPQTPPPAPEAPREPAPSAAEVLDMGVIALGPESAGQSPEDPHREEPLEVERFDRPKTMVFGDKEQPGAEPVLESLVSLSPFTPRPSQTGEPQTPEAADRISPVMTIGAVGEQSEPPAFAVAGQAPGETSGFSRAPTGLPPRLTRTQLPPESSMNAPRRGPAGRQKIFLGVVAGAGLCLGTLLFLFLRNPRQVVQTVSMDPADMRRKTSSASETPPASAGFGGASDPVSPAAAGGAGSPSTEPAAPAAPPSRDYISQDQRIRALDFVKEFTLGGGRGTIEQWFKYAFPSSANAEASWHAAALSANEYHVSYEVVKKGESGRTTKPIANYGFEVDLTAGTVSGTTPEARDLLASAGASAALPGPGGGGIGQKK